MQKLICALMLAGVLLSCQTTEEALPSPAVQTNVVSRVDLRSLEVAGSTSKLKASLTQEDGVQITSAKNLKPNSVYQLTIVGTTQLASSVIRNNEGFDVISEKVLPGRTIYSIRTASTLIERLYISVVPVVIEQNKLKKQVSQSFLIPEN